MQVCYAVERTDCAQGGGDCQGAQVVCRFVFCQGFLATYEEISGGAEQVGLTLTTHVSEDSEAIEAKMLSPRRRPSVASNHGRRSQRRRGVHVEGHPIKRFEQVKANKILPRGPAFGAIVCSSRKRQGKPILLLDDIFDKIDEKRVEALMKRVTNGTFGQVFITDTHLGRIPDMFAATGADVRVFEVRQGEVHSKTEQTMKRRRPVLRNSADYERAENSSRPLAEVIQHFEGVSHAGKARRGGSA